MIKIEVEKDNKTSTDTVSDTIDDMFLGYTIKKWLKHGYAVNSVYYDYTRKKKSRTLINEMKNTEGKIKKKST